LRRDRKLTVRAVEQATFRIAEAKNNKRFVVSNGWLTRLERGQSEPNIYKLFSLSVVYNIKVESLLKLYNIDVAEIEEFQSIAHPGATQLLSRNLIIDSSEPIQESDTALLNDVSGLQLDKQVGGAKNHLATSLTYGYIGLDDFTMYPLIRPGAIVRIDRRQNKFSVATWHTEYDRPIYFIELRDAYVCGWCELQNAQLLVIPHHSSPSSIRRFAYPRDAEIVGRVVSFDTACVDASSLTKPS
jgi:transcriptional regulator with XRE-family HTH domain